MIRLESTIGEIIRQYPDTFNVFLANGFRADSPDELINRLGDKSMLKTILKVKGFNAEVFIKILQDSIRKEENKCILLEHYPENNKLNFMGGSICPIISTFKDDFEEALIKHRDETGEIFKCFLPSGDSETEVYDRLYKEKDIKKFPDILISKWIDNFFSKEFINDMADKDYFKSCWNDNINKEFKEAGCLDPKGQYSMYAAALDVWLIDRKNLGDIPVPKTWNDLLNPIYKDKIITFGFTDGISKDSLPEDISNIPLLYFYKKHGEEGIKKFAHNVKDAWHGAKMAKIAGSTSKSGAAIYIVSWFFAKTCANQNTELVWPEDGAHVMPLYMLIRKDKIEKVKPLVDFITGKDFGEKCVKAYTPVLNPEVDNKLPEGVSLNWLGWDFIRENDIGFLSDHLRKVFIDEWKKLQKS